MAQVLEPQEERRRKRGRPKMLDTEIATRVPFGDYFLVNAIAFYERRDAAELMRMWINEKRKKYRSSGEFRRWLKDHADELREAGHKDRGRVLSWGNPPSSCT
jgi:hypothetical protein